MKVLSLINPRLFAICKQATTSIADLSAYPNPTKGVLTLESGSVFQYVKLELYTISGQKINTWQFEQFKKTTIDLPPSKGVYFLKVQSNSILQKDYCLNHQE